MADAEIKEKLKVSKEKLFKAITQYEDYPKFVENVTRVEVKRTSPTTARVVYWVSLMKDVSYTLDLTEDFEAGTVKWTLVESDFFKKNNGSWKIKALGDAECEAVYALDVDFKIPVPGFILSKLVKGNLPGMLKSFEKQAKK